MTSREIGLCNGIILSASAAAAAIGARFGTSSR